MATSKVKEGQVIENYQGRFAKVVSTNGNRFALTAWVLKKEDAEKDEKVVRHLNAFGLSQVLGEEKSGDATTEQSKAPAQPSDAAPEDAEKDEKTTAPEKTRKKK